MARRTKDIMIIDYDKCMRVPPEDHMLARKSTPMRCPSCSEGRDITMSGRLMFDGEAPPLCEPNKLHEEPVRMVPVS